MQYCVEVASNDPAFKVKPRFFKNGRCALSYAHHHKEMFPYHRVRIVLYVEFNSKLGVAK